MIKQLLLNLSLICSLTCFTNSFVWAQGTWRQVGASINGQSSGDNSGSSVHFAASGNVFATAASSDGAMGPLRGQVRVFARSGNSWVQKGANLNGEANGDFFGRSVALDSVGNTIVIGGPYNDAGQGSLSVSGHVKVYTWSGSAWTQKGSTLVADSAAENFGYSVSISYDGNTVAVGIPFSSGTGGVGKGRVKVYRWISNAWTQIGGNLNGINVLDNFGYSVSLDRTGNILAVGAPFHASAASGAGRTYIYNYSGTVWNQIGQAIDGNLNDNSGLVLSLSADGKRVAIGSPQDLFNSTNNGKAKVYEWNNTAWVQMGSDISSTYSYDGFGSVISISGNGNRIAIGAPDNNTSGSENGRAQIYHWNGTAWTLMGDTLKGVAAGDRAGAALSLSYDGNLLALGASTATGNAPTSGVTTIFSYCTPTNSSINITSCNGSYASPSGKYTWTTNGVYKDTIPNSGGCDSVITINLTIGTKPSVNLGADISTCTSTMLDAGNQGSTYLWNTNDTTRTLTVSTSGTYFVKVTNNGCFAYDTISVTITRLDTAVALSGTVLTAALDGASYKWLDCKNGLQAVTGGVNKTLNLLGCAGDTYSYAVELTKNGCKDTSSCQTGSLSWFKKGNDVAGEVTADKSGWAVSLSADGKTMAVGAINNDGGGANAGHVRVYSWNGTTWVQKGADINGTSAGQLFGYAISLSANGERIAIGAPGSADSAGYVRAFNWNGSSWEDMGGFYYGSEKYAQWGSAVSLSADGNTMAIGCPTTSGLGYVTTLKWDGSYWMPLSRINGEFNPSFFGRSLSLSADGQTLAIGDPSHFAGPINNRSLYAGHVRIFKLNGSTWVQQGGEIEGDLEYDRSGYGISLSADGKTVSIGTPLRFGTPGFCKVFSFNGTAWVQKGSTLSGTNPNDQFGLSASLSADGNMLVVGAPTNGSVSRAGYCRVFFWNGTAWVQQGVELVGDGNNVRHGYNVFISADGSTIAAGAPENTAAGGVVKTYTKCNNISTVSIKEENPLANVNSSITVYPNPSTGLFNLQTNEQDNILAIEVYNTMGQQVYSQVVREHATQLEFSLSTQPIGMYFVKVTTTTGNQTLRLMLQR